MRRAIRAATVVCSITTCFLAATALRATAQSAQSTAPPAWIEHGALYELFVRDFSPAGDFRGVIDGLDDVSRTGANIIWLMPIHPVGKLKRKGPVGSSYSVMNYHTVNPDYGSEADFAKLVDAVHARGMKLILDWVPNHTAWDNVWVASHPNRYVHDANGEMSAPRDNDGKLTDWSDVADLDYGDADLRAAMISEMVHWLETYDIDGFRVDVAGMVPDAFWKEAVPRLRAVKPILLLAEWGEPKMHTLGYDLTYGWDAYSKLKDVWRGAPAESFVAEAIADMRTLPPGGRRMRFTTNHDETAWDKPAVTLFGGSAGARAAFLAMALLPGMPLLYNGQEVESPQQLGLFVKEPIEWNQPHAADAREFYAHVIELARGMSADSITPVETTAPADVIAYRRGNYVVLVNTRPRTVEFDVSGETITLEPYGTRVRKETR